jgi:general secretion pathway protein C
MAMQEGRRSATSAGTRRTRADRIIISIAAGLLLLLGWQIARLVLVLMTPAGPLGPPPATAGASGKDREVAMRFDPFFRQTSEAASGVVTSLPLKLFGTRIDFATGRGSAIIATPDGVQSSYLVGETVISGAKLASVAGDHVEIDRNGTRERLYLDQSVPASTPAVGTAPPPAPMTPPVAPVAPAVQSSAMPSPPQTEPANAT